MYFQRFPILFAIIIIIIIIIIIEAKFALVSFFSCDVLTKILNQFVSPSPSIYISPMQFPCLHYAEQHK
jgi:hypothetical protein